MIDFLNPKSKRLWGIVYGILAILFIGFGSYLAFIPLKPLLSGVDNTYSLLPDNPDPNELSGFLVEDLHLPQNNFVERTELESETSKTVVGNTENEKETKVLGVSYTNTAKEQLAPSKVQDNRIVIPKMGVDTEILEGKTADTLWKGVWHMPMGSTPDKNGNTIITAHRYLYRPPSTKTFYLIDKMEIGDQILVYWNGLKYEYKVTGTKIVDPDEVEILHNTPFKQLTLFSCTPLFTSKQRLVVTAEPI